MAKNKFKKNSNRDINYEGLVSLGELKNGLRVADIVSLDDVEVDNFIGKCKVQIMRDGHIYITELPKRQKSTPLFRDDNCALTIGRNHMVYFSFCMPEALMDEIPAQLVRQSSAIAQKLMKEMILN